MTTWLGDAENDVWESDDSEGLFDSDFESDFDSEDYDSESRASQARQRRARQRAALAQRKQAVAAARSRALARGSARPPAEGAPAQRAAAAIRTLDLENKVQEDTFRSAFAAQSKRMSRGEYAAVAGAAVNQFIESFNTPDNTYAKAALRFSPLLLLSPQRRGSGVEGLIKDPRVIGGAAVAALAFFGDRRNLFRKAREIKIFRATPAVAKTKTTRLIGDVLDDRGNRLAKETVTWTVEPEGIARVDANGVVTGIAPGTVTITATSGDIVERVSLEVTE